MRDGDWSQRLAVAAAMSAIRRDAWRSMARYTVERPTPKSSATSRVLYSPLCTRETRCASCFRLSLGCLPRSRTLAFATLMLASTQPDEVGLELGDHGEDVDQRPADGVCGVVDRPSQAQAGLSDGQLIGDRAGIGLVTSPAGRAWSQPECRHPGRQRGPHGDRDGRGWCRSGRGRRSSAQLPSRGRLGRRVGW